MWERGLASARWSRMGGHVLSIQGLVRDEPGLVRQKRLAGDLRMTLTTWAEVSWYLGR